MDPDTHRFFLDYRLKLLDGQTISAVVYDNELFAEEDIRKLFPDVTTSQGSVETKLQQIIYNQNLLLKDSVNQNEKLSSLSAEIALVKDQLLLLQERNIINTTTQQQQL